jgi:hypothetical protein
LRSSHHLRAQSSKGSRALEDMAGSCATLSPWLCWNARAAAGGCASDIDDPSVARKILDCRGLHFITFVLAQGMSSEQHTFNTIDGELRTNRRMLSQECKTAES